MVQSSTRHNRRVNQPALTLVVCCAQRHLLFHRKTVQPLLSPITLPLLVTTQDQNAHSRNAVRSKNDHFCFNEWTKGFYEPAFPKFFLGYALIFLSFILNSSSRVKRRLSFPLKSARARAHTHNILCAQVYDEKSGDVDRAHFFSEGGYIQTCRMPHKIKSFEE